MPHTVHSLGPKVLIALLDGHIQTQWLSRESSDRHTETWTGSILLPSMLVGENGLLLEHTCVKMTLLGVY